MIEAATATLYGIPVPILVILGAVLLSVLSNLKPGKPTPLVKLEREPGNAPGRPIGNVPPSRRPPPMPTAAAQRARLQQASAAAARAQAAAPAQAAARAQAATRQAVLVRSEPNAAAVERKRPSAAPAASPAKPTTVAANARALFQRGGLRDAIILSEILGAPKSMR